MRFPIYIHKTESGTYSGFVPDVIGCYFAGDTFADTIQDAAEAIDAHVEFTVDEGGSIPQAKSFDDYLNHEDCQGGAWAYVDVDLSKYEGKAVKLNITIAQNLLARIDRYVEKHREYGSRSGFLAELARRELAKL